MPRRPLPHIRTRKLRWLDEIKRRGFADEVPQLDTVDLMEWAYQAAQRLYVGRIRARVTPRDSSDQRFITGT